MITLEEFIQLSLDDSYLINIYECEDGIEIIHQEPLYELQYELKELNKEYLLYKNIGSWDINENIELTINM